MKNGLSPGRVRFFFGADRVRKRPATACGAAGKRICKTQLLFINFAHF